MSTFSRQGTCWGKCGRHVCWLPARCLPQPREHSRGLLVFIIFSKRLYCYMRAAEQTCLLPSLDVTLLYRTLMLLLADSPISGSPLSHGEDGGADDGRSARCCSMRRSRFGEAFLSSAARRKKHHHKQISFVEAGRNLNRSARFIGRWQLLPGPPKTCP